jgi:hypothetical protein
MALRLAPALLFTGALLSDCTSVANAPPRIAASSYQCMAAVVKEKVPGNVPDKRAHCLAAGLIARYCSRTEAYIAGAGKEFRDLFTGGDFEWADWRADRAGIGCALRTGDDAALAACCSTVGY